MIDMAEMFMGPRKTAKRIGLVANYYAEKTEDNTFVVKQDGRMASPYEYTQIQQIANGWNTFALHRGDGRVDILFRDGTWVMGAWDVLAVRGSEVGPWAVAVLTDRGITLASNITDRVVHFDSYPFVTVYRDAFIFVYDPNPPGPYVRAFSFDLQPITEGYQWEVEEFLAEFDV